MASIESVPVERLDEVNDFLIEHFFSLEPLGLKLGINPDEDVRPWLSKVTKPLLEQQVNNFKCTF